MGKKLDSSEMGLDCGFIACAQTEGEVVQKLGNHIQAFHAMQGFSEDFYSRLLSSIHDGVCEAEPFTGELLCQACSGTCTC